MKGDGMLCRDKKFIGVAGLVLVMALCFPQIVLAEAESKYPSQPVRISAIYQGEYESAWAAGSFEAFCSGKQIPIVFEWQTLKVYSENKEIKSDRTYLDTFLRERLAKGKKIDLVGNWYKNTNTFKAGNIYLH